MYLGSPRMAEMVIGEKVTLEEMGGARMHCAVSGCGDVLAKDEAGAHRRPRALPRPTCRSARTRRRPRPTPPRRPRAEAKRIEEIIPADENKSFDMMAVIDAIIDEGSFFEIKKLFAREIVTGFARIDGAAGRHRRQPAEVEGRRALRRLAPTRPRASSGCATRSTSPLLFLADVPGFMIGTKVERQGIIRAGAKMIAAVSEATVPKISVVVRKAYGAGLYAMCGPGFEPDACLALPQASIAVMGAEAAVNAVYYNKIQEKPRGRARRLRREAARRVPRGHRPLKLAGELHVDAVIPGDELRAELLRRLSAAGAKVRTRVPAPPAGLARLRRSRCHASVAQI